MQVKDTKIDSREWDETCECSKDLPSIRLSINRCSHQENEKMAHRMADLRDSDNARNPGTTAGRNVPGDLQPRGTDGGTQFHRTK